MTTSFRYKVDRLVAQQTSCAVMTYGPNGVVFQNIEPPPPPTPKPPPPPFKPLNTPVDAQELSTKLAIKMLNTVDDAEDLLIDFHEWATEWLLANKLATTNLLDRHEPADKDTRLKLDRKTGKVRFAKEDEDWDDD